MGVYYHAMMSNGFNTLNLQPNRLNNRFCWSGSTWWEPWGDFGRGYSDLQNHEEAAIRLGVSYTYAIGRGSQSDSDAVENSPVRLSDGTIITTPGALAPGVTLQIVRHLPCGPRPGVQVPRPRSVDGVVLPGPARPPGHRPACRSAPRSAFGGFLQGGYFILPQQAELYARTSLRDGTLRFRLGSGRRLELVLPQG